MDAILHKANELGLMIRGTKIYQDFSEILKRIESDSTAKSLLEEYVSVSKEYQEKEASGTVIEIEAKRVLKELSEKVSANDLLKEYITCQSTYINLMMQIEGKISNPEGDPIGETKIIEPKKGGNIITDI